MAEKKEEKKIASGMRKHGRRNKNRYSNYKVRQSREKHKLKKILRSNGKYYAKLYASSCNPSLLAFLTTIHLGR